MGVLYLVAAPADNSRGPRYMQEALAAIHQANRTRLPLTLIYAAIDGQVGLILRVPDELANLVENLLIAKYPGCALKEIADEDIAQSPTPGRSASSQLHLRLVPDLFPILRHSQFEDIHGGSFTDPIDAVLQSVEGDAESDARIEIEIAPALQRRQRRATRAVTLLDRPFFRLHERTAVAFARLIMHPLLWPVGWFLGLLAPRSLLPPTRQQTETTGGRHHEREDDVQAASDKIGGHLFDARIRLVAPGDKQNADTRFAQMIGAIGSFTVSRLATFKPSRSKRSRTFLLSHEELATLWHPPLSTVGAANLHTTEFTELPAPQRFRASESEGAALGRVKHRSDQRAVVLAPDDRRRHLYIVGKTGMGKTTLLENLIRTDIDAGRGVAVIDPHGDLADSVTAAIPPKRTNEVIVFDPSDEAFVVAYNPLKCFDAEKHDLVADDVLSAFSKVYNLSQTPRLKDTLRNALYVLIEKDMTLMELLQLLSDERFRRDVTFGIEDDVVRMFWETEFTAWNSRYRTEALSAVQNKVRPFLMNRRIRSVVANRRRPINLRRILDDGQVLIVNLSKGKLGEENAHLLGALLVSSLQQAAMSRADVAENDRRDFYLYVDEFQNFTTGSFATILSEARKYRLNLTVAHQYLRQLDDETADAVFGNVGSIAAFQVGSDDAEMLARQLAKYPGQIAPRDIANLPRYTAYVRMLLDGLPTSPFSMETIAPKPLAVDRFRIVREASRRRYGRATATVERHAKKALVAS